MANNKLMVLWLYAAIIGMLCGGCHTTNPSGKVLATVAVTVDGAMKGWAIWVHNGNATVEQEAKVKAAYIKYQAAMKVAQEAYKAAYAAKDDSIMTQLVVALQASSDDLIALIQSFEKEGAK